MSMSSNEHRWELGLSGSIRRKIAEVATGSIRFTPETATRLSL